MKIAIYIPDLAWGNSSDESYEIESAANKQALQKEFSKTFRRVNIGPGADFLSFETLISVSSWWYLGPLALFFFGKRIRDNFEAWSDMLSKFLPFVEYRPYLDRNGSGILAVVELLKSVREIPTSLQLVGYDTTTLFADDLDEDLKAYDFLKLTKIRKTPDPLYLTQTVHAFRVKCNDIEFGILVYRDRVSIRQI